ncbi:MAG: hypothetical protein U5L09_12635 [Bacteroidales bacterium]|nr:hypothetical protein [Bacteroidales bacterium]
MDGNQYKCIVQPGNVTSNAATLTVTYTISGTIKYANTSGAERPINTNGTSTTEVILYESDGVTEVTRVNADINGDYVFNGVVAGNYVVTAVTDKPWVSGVTLADYAITRSFVNTGTPLLQNIYWLAADVNSTNTVTLADYAIIRNRVNTSSTAGWSGPDWIFEEVSVNLSGSVSTDILGIVSGDVNATYTF